MDIERRMELLLEANKVQQEVEPDYTEFENLVYQALEGCDENCIRHWIFCMGQDTTRYNKDEIDLIRDNLIQELR